MNLSKAIPITLEESGWKYDGPFSTYKEIHSAILGLGAGLTGAPELQAGVVTYALGRGSRAGRDSGQRADAHLRQVAEEPAYAVGGMAVGGFVRHSFTLFGVL